MRWTLASLVFGSLVGSATVALAQPGGEPPPTDPAPPAPEPGAPPTPAPPVLAVEPAPHATSSMIVVSDMPPPTVERTVELRPRNGNTEFTLDGYVQPQFRVREDSAAQNDTNGFRFARVRPQLRAATMVGSLQFNATLEVEFQPAFEMLDAFIGATAPLGDGGALTVDVGQMRTPISRQQMLSDSRLSFVDKAQLQSIAPRRDLGARVTFAPPALSQLKVFLGAYNGEGQNQIENIDQKFLYTARLAYTILGEERALAESAFDGDYLTIAATGAYNGLSQGDRDEAVYYYGADIAGAYKGISGSVEWLEVNHKVSSDTSVMIDDYKQNGWAGHLAYLLPVHVWRESRLEVAARLEEVDRNDTVAIVNPGDTEQSIRIYTGNVTYYLRKHSLKAALSYSHFQEIEDRTAAFQNASYANDQVILQLTYRME